jgi:hypothetical protein
VYSVAHSGVLGGSIFALLASVIQQFADWMRILLIGAPVWFNPMICWLTTFLPSMQIRTTPLFLAV